MLQMTATPGPVRRVVLVVMDGLRPDAIRRFELSTLAKLAAQGASTFHARTVRPSVTACAMTSLLTGASPELHGMQSDQFRVPRPRGMLHPMPRVLASHSLPTSAFMAQVGPLMRPFAHQAAAILGIGEARFSGDDAHAIVEAAKRQLQAQRRGLLVMHWPDADRAGHEHGWMSQPYGRAARSMDRALGTVTELIDLRDPGELLVVVADHGGGGGRTHEHDSDHPLDHLIPVVFAGGGVAAAPLAGPVTLLDVPATILWSLGVPRPASYAGRALTSILHSLPVAA
jgi:predicted AlkP superfamily pyrophosphatase or phosphodiesterase